MSPLSLVKFTFIYMVVPFVNARNDLDKNGRLSKLLKIYKIAGLKHLCACTAIHQGGVKPLRDKKGEGMTSQIQ